VQTVPHTSGGFKPRRTSDPHQWKLLEMLMIGIQQDTPDAVGWPKEGRVITLPVRDDNDKPTTLKFKAVFKENGKPICFPFPLPPS
jgi:hypothetical protein